MGCEDLFHFYADVAYFGQSDFCSFEANARASMWQGNSVTLWLHLFVNGVPVDDLAAALSGTFQAMGHRDNVAGNTQVYPGTLSINDPEIGVVKVFLGSAVTDLMEGEYDLAIEFTWADKKYVWRFGKTLYVMRDQILFP